jgi:hypothetical protein
VTVISRDELVGRFAAVSHETWMRQKHRDHGVPVERILSDMTDHDVERAEDAVAELERLGPIHRQVMRRLRPVLSHLRDLSRQRDER